MSTFRARLHGYGQRKAAELFFPRRFRITTEQPIISFTFDDFPRSALFAGGAILRRLGVRGTYYASFGLIGTTAPTGQMFTIDDLNILLDQRHEIGCHTYDHCDSWDTHSKLFKRSIIENQVALRKVASNAVFKTFSYPISPPRPWTKRLAGKHFACCRGSGQTFNAGKVDLNYLRACFLEQTKENCQMIEGLIDRNREARGWLIFATHDVDRHHTRFGCTPDFFEYVVQCAVNSGARILPMIEALESLRQGERTTRS